MASFLCLHFGQRTASFVSVNADGRPSGDLVAVVIERDDPQHRPVGVYDDFEAVGFRSRTDLVVSGPTLNLGTIKRLFFSLYGGEVIDLIFDGVRAVV